MHRSWGPVEPFDDSMPAILDANGIHSHLASDHYHYWGDGGATYHNRYTSWEGFRGQEGDRWKGVVGGVPDSDPALKVPQGDRYWRYKQDLVNRSYMQREEDHSQAKTFKAGLEFIETNAAKDKWYLQIECFDPHEPFFSTQHYKDLYPSDYKGKRFDWPAYEPVAETPEEVAEARRNYFALLSMCDASVGKVLDMFDKKGLWDDTMLIVCTDHGLMLGERGFWGKNYMPPYNELVNTPLFIWDPRFGKKDESRKGLVQTIDIPATILDFFGLSLPPDFMGRPIAPLIAHNKTTREAGIFGYLGGYACVTDGSHILMKAPVNTDEPFYEYTLMPTHMMGFFTPEEIKSMEKVPPFKFTKGMPLMRFVSQNNRAELGGRLGFGPDMLFDLTSDRAEEHNLADDPAKAGLKADMTEKLVSLMKAADAPKEVYSRLGLA
jgi:arylsulfatase A-like enzyme